MSARYVYALPHTNNGSELARLHAHMRYAYDAHSVCGGIYRAHLSNYYITVGGEHVFVTKSRLLEGQNDSNLGAKPVFMRL